MCNSAAKPDPTRPTRTFAMSALLSEWARILYGNPVDWFAAEHHARFTLPWTGRVGSEHFASCRGGVIQLHAHPARVLRTLADLPPPGGGGRVLPRRVRTDHPDSVLPVPETRLCGGGISGGGGETRENI